MSAFHNVPSISLCITGILAIVASHIAYEKVSASELDTKQSAISKYETRKARYKVEDIITLCEYYGVSADYILGLPENLKYPKR